MQLQAALDVVTRLQSELASPELLQSSAHANHLADDVSSLVDALTELKALPGDAPVPPRLSRALVSLVEPLSQFAAASSRAATAASRASAISTAGSTGELHAVPLVQASVPATGLLRLLYTLLYRCQLPMSEAEKLRLLTSASLPLETLPNMLHAHAAAHAALGTSSRQPPVALALPVLSVFESIGLGLEALVTAMIALHLDARPSRALAAAQATALSPQALLSFVSTLTGSATYFAALIGPECVPPSLLAALRPLLRNPMFGLMDKMQGLPATQLLPLVRLLASTLNCMSHRCVLGTGIANSENVQQQAAAPAVAELRQDAAAAQQAAQYLGVTASLLAAECLPGARLQHEDSTGNELLRSAVKLLRVLHAAGSHTANGGRQQASVDLLLHVSALELVAVLLGDHATELKAAVSNDQIDRHQALYPRRTELIVVTMAAALPHLRTVLAVAAAAGAAAAAAAVSPQPQCNSSAGAGTCEACGQACWEERAPELTIALAAWARLGLVLYRPRGGACLTTAESCLAAAQAAEEVLRLAPLLPKLPLWSNVFSTGPPRRGDLTVAGSPLRIVTAALSTPAALSKEIEQVNAPQYFAATSPWLASWLLAGISPDRAAKGEWAQLATALFDTAMTAFKYQWAVPISAASTVCSTGGGPVELFPLIFSGVATGKVAAVAHDACVAAVQMVLAALHSTADPMQQHELQSRLDCLAISYLEVLQAPPMAELSAAAFQAAVESGRWQAMELSLLEPEPQCERLAGLFATPGLEQLLLGAGGVQALLEAASSLLDGLSTDSVGTATMCRRAVGSLFQATLACRAVADAVAASAALLHKLSACPPALLAIWERKQQRGASPLYEERAFQQLWQLLQMLDGCHVQQSGGQQAGGQQADTQQAPKLDPAQLAASCSRLAAKLATIAEAVTAPRQPKPKPIATSSTAAGQDSELLLLRRARAVALRSCANLRCANLAGASEAECRGRRCGGCRVVRYCSEACSRSNWRQHRAACRLLGAGAGSA